MCPSSYSFCRLLPLVLLCALCRTVCAQPHTQPAADAADPADIPQDPAPDAVEVPDGILDGGTGWLNTANPISMKDLRGKVVVLDFWTYCCINCMHVLPDLKLLEEKYPDELVVIGVHSAKFDNEKDSANIRNAILRHGIQHPVVNDSEMIIWRKFGVRAWPTLALVDPQGRYLGSRSGEGNREVIEQIIDRVIAYHRANGTLDESPIVFDLETRRSADTPLRYPGKVLADAVNNRLFISDTAHNRIVISDLEGTLQNVIGSGRIGRKDGDATDAEFDHPQGLCLVDQTLYVADTENHLLRAIDLETKQVTTLAGTGHQGRPGVSRGALLSTSLNSPWDICHIDGVLYIAMAGPHQIWSHVIGSNEIRRHAGNGREDVINGPLEKSSFAQPSGFAVSADAKAFFVVDSEGSAIRRVPTSAEGTVTTVAGTSELPRGQSLFAFGDVDGTGADARFQHPIGIARHAEHLYVADSYNHKIRRLNPDTGEVSTWLGDGTAGESAEDPVRLNEPSGLSVSGDTLYIADANNHRICAVDIASKAIRVLPLDGLTPPDSSALQETNVSIDLSDAIEIDAGSVAAGRGVVIYVDLSVPAGGHLNELAPVSWKLTSVSGNLIAAESAKKGKADVTDNQAAIPMTLSPDAETGTLGLAVSYGYCESDESLCRLATGVWKIALTVSADEGADRIDIAFPESRL